MNRWILSDDEKILLKKRGFLYKELISFDALTGAIICLSIVLIIVEILIILLNQDLFSNTGKAYEWIFLIIPIIHIGIIFIWYMSYMFYDNTIYLSNGFSVWNFGIKKSITNIQKRIINIIQFIIRLYEELNADFFIILFLSSIWFSMLFILVNVSGLYNIIWEYATLFYSIIALPTILCFTFIARFFSYTYRLKNELLYIYDKHTSFIESIEMMKKVFQKDIDFWRLREAFNSTATSLDTYINTIIQIESLERKIDKWDIFDSAKYTAHIKSEIRWPLESLKDFFITQKWWLIWHQIDIIGLDNPELVLAWERSDIILTELTKYIAVLDTMIRKL